MKSLFKYVLQQYKKQSVIKNGNALIVILLAHLIFLPIKAFSKDFSLDLMSINTGSWIAFIDRNPDKQISYFNKITTDSYFSFLGLKGYLGLPFLWTVETHFSQNEKVNSLTRKTFAPADMSVYIGKKVSLVEPRIGFLFPLFYPTNNAWIGSKNIRLQLGIGLNSNVHETERVNISGEIMWQLYISGNKNIEDALAYPSSWDMLPQFKFSVKPSDQWRIGIELLGFIKKSYWVWLNNKEYYEATLGVVPNIFADFDITEKINLGLKVGYGPSAKGIFKTNSGFNLKDLYYSENSLNISISYNIYNY
jgi:hypothetical protein